MQFIKKILVVSGLLGLYFLPAFGIAQPEDRYYLKGKVTGEDKTPLPGAHVHLLPLGKVATTDMEGAFHFKDIPEGKYSIEVTFLGYEKNISEVTIGKDSSIIIRMLEQLQTLQEVVVADNYALRRNREESLNVEVVNDIFLKQNLRGSLMQTLERLPGISSIDIGSGQSKPVIRGLAFNRVAVIENGIKHEGQQWGTDHGLEIDQFAYDRIEIIKGPGSLLYGSDAIGGIINLKQAKIPPKHSVGGNVHLIGKSNNRLAGTSAEVFARDDHFYIKLLGTLLDYADYKVPADSIDIYSYRAALHNNRLRNTAGKEQNLHLLAGFLNNDFSGRLNISNIATKQGFFANTHGLEPRRVDAGLHDESARDIHMPFQEVNHLKVSGSGSLGRESFSLRAELGFQQNNRKEWSTYTRHGYMPPATSVPSGYPPELERQFKLTTWTGNLAAHIKSGENIELSAGINSEFHNNEIDGRGFIIPAYEKNNIGAFTVMKYKISKQHQVQAGIRYDFGNISTEAYHDWYPTPVSTTAGTSDSLLQRAPALDRSFANISWSIGWNFTTELVELKINSGKSFRMPIAKELAANGVNYHRFSFERGNPHLSPEISYQLDAGIEFHNRLFAMGLTPFANYFPNYIYLNPGYEHDRLYGNGNQVFNYTQTKVFRIGTELHAHYSVTPSLKTGVIFNYLWSEQLSGDKKGFTLPFSPPASALLHFKYEPESYRYMRDPYLSLDINVTRAQNRIVPPELTTAGYTLLDLSAGTEISIKSQPLHIMLQVNNLLNTAYFNHTSYYRLINVPGPSRNVTMGLQLPF